MAFFPRNFYNTSDSSFTPLFRLLDDFDNYSRQDGQGRRTGLAGLTHWQPKFDIRETDDAYELHGELPGVSKEHVNIEFTEPQTMTIRGKTERTYTSGTPPAGFVEGSTSSGAITEGSDDKASHKARVEDENEEAGKEQPVEGTQEVEKRKNESARADKAKYWLTERSIGEFSRSFTFPTRVEHDAVSANFKDGILNIAVPKAKKHETRRITVN